jgi:cysteine-rich repeat protein
MIKTTIAIDKRIELVPRGKKMRKINRFWLTMSMAWLLAYSFACQPNDSWHRSHESEDISASEVDVPIDVPKPNTPVGLIETPPGIGALPGPKHPVLAAAVPIVLETDKSNPLQDLQPIVSINQGAFKPARLNREDDEEHNYNCSNGELNKGEQCDDGNSEDSDACNNQCEVNIEGCTFYRNNLGSYIFCGGDSDPGIQAEGLSWSDAQEACSSFGSYQLVTINSETENDFLTSIIDDAPWIGLNDQSSEGDFVWASGQAVVYTNWEDGEPNNSGDEDCAQIYSWDGKWNDGTCSSAIGYICEANS